MTSPDLISKNLKLLKIDIWIHSLLLFLWLAIPVGFYLLSFTLPDQKPCIYSTPECSSPRDEMILSIMNILLFTGIVSIIWQIVSWFLHRDLVFSKNYNTRIKKISGIVISYHFTHLSLLLLWYLVRYTYLPRTTETQLCVDIKPRNWIRILKN